MTSPASMNLRQRLWLLLSQVVNAVVFRGDPDESLSARAWRQREDGWARAQRRIDRILGAGHCQRVHAAQIARQQARS